MARFALKARMSFHGPMKLEAPIIVIGAGGSGSTLLNNVLGAHPMVAMLGETRFLVSDAWEAFCRADANTTVRDLQHHFDADPALEEQILQSPARFEAFLGALERTEFQRRGAVLRRAMAAWFCLPMSERPYWGFKEIFNSTKPWAPYDYVFPDATWVHIVRHPLRQVRAAARLSATDLTAGYAKQLLQSWRDIVARSGERAETGRYLEVRYEDLVSSPQATLAPLFDRLDLNWSDECALPLSRQWGERSTRTPLPIAITDVLAEIPDLAALMRRFAYEADDAQSEPTRFAPPLPRVIADGNGRWRIDSPLLREEGHCWQFDLAHIEMASALAAVADDVGLWRRSTLRLFENDGELGPGHALHFRIRADGAGLYSHWQNRLLFSTSDNSNPNTNGRAYSFTIGS